VPDLKALIAIKTALEAAPANTRRDRINKHNELANLNQLIEKYATHDRFSETETDCKRAPI
jgi:enolase